MMTYDFFLKTSIADSGVSVNKNIGSDDKYAPLVSLRFLLDLERGKVPLISAASQKNRLGGGKTERIVKKELTKTP